MAHPAHPHPQDAFPFLLLFLIPAIITVTIIIKITLIIIVARFPAIHVSIKIPPVTDYLYTYTFIGTFTVSLTASLYGLNSI